MRALLVLVGLTGLLAVAVIGCSEKQKEAARLEARLKLGDTVAPSEGEVPTDSSSQGLLDTTVAKISAEILAQPDEKRSDTTASDVSRDTSGATQPVLTESGSDGPDLSQTQRDDISDEILDASAIPDEEQIKKSPAPATAVATDLSAPPQGSGYVVQVSSTPDLREANALAAKFNRNGYHAFVTEVFVEGTTYFRVRIGKYSTIAEAEAALSELNQKFGVSGFIAQVK
jgi:cell division septation protein DedD